MLAAAAPVDEPRRSATRPTIRSKFDALDVATVADNHSLRATAQQPVPIMPKSDIDPANLGVRLPPPPIVHVLEELPLLLDANSAAGFLGLGRSTFYRCDRRGLIPRGIRLGKLRRWSRIELRQWVEKGCLPRHRWEDVRK